MIGRRPSGFRLASVIGLTCWMLNCPAWAEHESLPPDYPASLEREVAVLQSQIATKGETVQRLVAGAGLYLDIADDLFEDAPQKRLAYESAAEMAKRALQLEERNAQAHFLYAAALGSAERLKGLANAGLVLGEIKAHIRRAIELDPAHAQALQMMGGLYAELPWLLGDARRKPNRTCGVPLRLMAAIPMPISFWPDSLSSRAGRRKRVRTSTRCSKSNTRIIPMPGNADFGRKRNDYLRRCLLRMLSESSSLGFILIEQR